MDREHYPVLRNAPFIWLGHSVLYSPYRIVRSRSIHSHIVACVSGQGRTVIDGKLVKWNQGQVLLGPVGIHHAFEVDGDGPWEIAWVFYEDFVRAPVLRQKKAQLIQADIGDFVTLVHMLTREAAGSAQPAAMEALVTLLDVWARRIAGSNLVDQRIWRMWVKVEGDLAHDWSVSKLARLACISEEHLRRLCQQHYQRSPMAHLTHLRLRRAATMLRSTPEKIDEIARSVGYASMYTFSVAFRRWSGLPPSRFRKGIIAENSGD